MTWRVARSLLAPVPPEPRAMKAGARASGGDRSCQLAPRMGELPEGELDCSTGAVW